MTRRWTILAKALGYGALGVGALLGAAAGTVVAQRSAGIGRARRRMGPPAGQLVVDGRTFRDLNKNGRLDPYEDWRLPVAERVEDLVARMTLEEKAGALFHAPIFPGRGGRVAGATTLANIAPVEDLLFTRHMNAFNLFLLEDARSTALWLNRVQKLAERTRLGIPATISSDPRHAAVSPGSVAAFDLPEFSKWPEPIGLGALRDVELVERFGRVVAREFRAVGINMALHPQADIATEPRWARIAHCFGEDADLVAAMTAAFVRGLQGEALGPSSVAAVTKHFAGGGPQEDGLDAHFRYGARQIYPGDHLRYHLKPFQAAIEAGTASIMPYYGLPVDQGGENVAFNFNRHMLTDILRGELGFEGVILSDWRVLTPIEPFGLPAERFVPVLGVKNYGVEHLAPYQRAGKALEAGVDQFGGEYEPGYILRLVEEGRLTVERIDRSVRRIMTLKFQLGLFDDPYVDADATRATLAGGEAAAFGRRAQRASQVLLVNRPARDGSGAPTLPLGAGTKVYLHGIDAEGAGFDVRLVAHPDEADVAIVNLPPPFDPAYGRMFRQGRTYYTPRQLRRVRRLALRMPTVVTFNLERPFVIPELAGIADAILANFGAAPEAIFAVLFGHAAPEGRLPFDMPSSWQSVLDQKPDVPFDAAEPLFRFGYGLRYETILSEPSESSARR